jgi:hypothetical protein
MSEQEDPWPRLVHEAAGGSADEVTVTAQTFLRRWATASNPVLVGCDDGHDYVVKGRQAGRMLVNDHVVARLGGMLAAPVGHVALVDVPQGLVDAEPQMAHMPAGLSHGCRWIPNCSERESILHTDLAENRSRFARLAVLYGWVRASDHQFIYENATPHLVHSVDHGHHFPSGPDWTVESLANEGSPVVDAALQAACGFTNEEIEEARALLDEVDDLAVARIVCGPPDEWGLSLEERVGLGRYLGQRRDELGP